MLVPQLLLETLEELRDDDFETLKWYLSMDILEGCKPIPKSRLGKAPRTDTVSRMIESYGEESAVKVTVEILRKMGNINAAEKLKSRYAGGKTTKPPTAAPVAPPAAPPAAPATLLDQLLARPPWEGGVHIV
ncbi:uncharacterized protein LOC126390196 isoform X3 [Epinephelus moara]|uniref:uncharacterized protein LOC126390196 isoform X3 n=1 Tax=Epinephelus moara TaxID=300413 RepID=UPI00214E5C99|nr:uncharacterized protein LOC126390196 isoform X3 [Epinephelus moara]XP_049900338.1 uncharacterized protein LOC126390196 isoform X3 [Epinephelus moara]